MSEQFGNSIWIWRTNLGWSRPRRACLARGIDPNPVPTNCLSQRAMQYNVYSLNRARRESTLLSATVFQEMSIEVIDVRRSELGDRTVPEMRNQMTVDETSCLTMCRRRPSWRRSPTPLFEEVGHCSRAQSALARDGSKLCELCGGVPSTAVDRLGGPLFLSARSIDPLIDPKFPCVRASLTN